MKEQQQQNTGINYTLNVIKKEKGGTLESSTHIQKY